MIHRIECLICGRPGYATGEPSCDCVTHTLFRPVAPPTHGPDPADVALFPLEAETAPRVPRPRVAGIGERAVQSQAPPGQGSGGAPGQGAGQDAGRGPGGGRPPRAHRRPRQRARLAVAASGAVAAVVGCTALAASLLPGHGRDGRADDGGAGPTLALPDAGLSEWETADDAPPEDEDAATPDARGGGTGTATASPSPGDRRTTDPTDAAGPIARPTPSGEEPPGPRPSPGAGDPATTPSPPASASGPSAPTTPEPAPTAPDAPQRLVLREGDRGPEVVELQQRLIQLNWVYTGEAHGRFDGETRAAVERFQVAYGVRGDSPGVYGPVTRGTLEAHTAEP